MKMKLIINDTSDDNNNRSDYTARTDVVAPEVDDDWDAGLDKDNVTKL